MPELVVNQTDEDAVLREVFDIGQIEAKTELNGEQIERINKANTLAVMFNNGLLKAHLKGFMVLQKSKDRKSMGEFVSVVKAKREDFVDKGRGFFQNMLG